MGKFSVNFCLFLSCLCFGAVEITDGACSQFGHSCFGAHGKRSEKTHPMRLSFSGQRGPFDGRDGDPLDRTYLDAIKRSWRSKNMEELPLMLPKMDTGSWEAPIDLAVAEMFPIMRERLSLLRRNGENGEDVGQIEETGIDERKEKLGTVQRQKMVRNFRDFMQELKKDTNKA